MHESGVIRCKELVFDANSRQVKDKSRMQYLIDEQDVLILAERPGAGNGQEDSRGE